MTDFNNRWLRNGIACVGDSLTEGFGGGGVSYPAVLEEKIRELQKKMADGNPFRVENLGVCGEDTFTILGRSGALPLCWRRRSGSRRNGNGARFRCNARSAPKPASWSTETQA